jgi:hypothetical protein
MIPLVSGSAAPLHTSGFAVLFVHLEPKANFMIWRYMRFEKWDERPGNQSIELKQPRRGQPVFQDQFHLLLHGKQHIHLKSRLNFSNEVDYVDAAQRTHRSGQAGSYEGSGQRSRAKRGAGLPAGLEKIASGKHSAILSHHRFYDLRTSRNRLKSAFLGAALPENAKRDAITKRSIRSFVVSFARKIEFAARFSLTSTTKYFD